MLHINDLTYRAGSRLLIDRASASVPAGHKSGLVGGNGTGKSTLLRLILGEIEPESGTISVPKSWRIGAVAQEAPGGESRLIDTVLAADMERSDLLSRADQAVDAHEIGDIQTRLADIGAHAAPARAASILAGLGFSEDAQQAPCSALSGGWRMRVALASALFAEPDLLLLDEPTNYLDLEGVIWLKSFLKSSRSSVLLVSHDRDLFNDAVSTIVHLEARQLTVYTGNYDDFDRRRRERQALQVRLKRKQDDARRHMQAFVDRFRYKASKARQAQSRLKMLQKMEPGAEVIDGRVTRFDFPAPGKMLNPPLLRFEDASAGYGGKPVLSGLNLRIDPDDRIALLGANGNGKSTLAKLLCARLAPLTGRAWSHKDLKTAYFAQHQMDELPPGQTPYDIACTLMPRASEADRRARLGGFGFPRALADTRTNDLSGGEKARLLFAIATFGGAHLLVLDEPANHLDIAARGALTEAINRFDGAVIVISHDRRLAEATVDRLWLVADGTVSNYDGDFDTYGAYVLSQSKRARATAPGRQRANRQLVERQQRAARRAALHSLNEKVQRIESAISKIQEKMKTVDVALADSALYRDNPQKAQEYAKLRARLAGQLEAAEADWLHVQESLELAGP